MTRSSTLEHSPLNQSAVVYQTNTLAMLRPALSLFILLTIILGLIYPLAVTAVAKLSMPHQANGSLVMAGQQVIGSSLIAQKFDQPKYLWPRPSAADYDAKASTGSNLGPLNPSLIKNVQTQVNRLHESDPTNTQPIPQSLVTMSASGLDPHLSPDAADWQVGRIAKARGISPDVVRQVIERHTTAPRLGVLGEPTVNVLAVNYDLDQTTP